MESLFKDDPVGKAKRDQRRVDRATDVGEVIARYIARFTDRFGFAPKIERGKEHRHVKDLVTAWGKADVLRLVDAYFESLDPRITRGDYSLSWLFLQAQYLRLQDHRVDDRTAGNLDAATRAVGRKR